MIVYGVDPAPKLEDFNIVKLNVISGMVLVSNLGPFEFRTGTRDFYLETMTPYGVRMGWPTLNTLVEIGRFKEIFKNEKVTDITRVDVKNHLLGKSKGDDTDVRDALIERFGEKGTKSKPGRLYGLSGHHLAAVAVAVTGWGKETGVKLSYV